MGACCVARCLCMCVCLFVQMCFFFASSTAVTGCPMKRLTCGDLDWVISVGRERPHHWNRHFHDCAHLSSSALCHIHPCLIPSCRFLFFSICSSSLSTLDTTSNAIVVSILFCILLLPAPPPSALATASPPPSCNRAFGETQCGLELAVFRRRSHPDVRCVDLSPSTLLPFRQVCARLHRLSVGGFRSRLAATVPVVSNLSCAARL